MWKVNVCRMLFGVCLLALVIANTGCPWFFVAPDAAFTASPTSGPVPLTVQFVDWSSSGSSPITQYSWDFGDGSGSQEKNPAHTYTTSGTFSVSLTVSSAAGTDTAVQTAIISVASTVHLEVPGAQIVSRGEVYEGVADIPLDDLAAINYEGKSYLYHPAMGAAELSEENSRRAVGYWVSAYGQNKSALKASGDIRNVATGLQYVQVNDTTFRFTNTKKRWAAVVSGAVGQQQVFLGPRDGVPTNLLTALREAEAGSLFQGGERDVSIDTNGADTYGSVVRALSAPTGSWVLLLPGITEAFEHDPDVFVLVNAVDFVDLTFGGLQSIAGLDPSACVDTAAVAIILEAFKTFATSVLTSRDPEAMNDLKAELAEELVQEVGLCACNASALGAVVCAPVSELLGILGAFNWVLDDVAIGYLDAMTSAVYAKVPGTQASTRVVRLGVGGGGDLNFGQVQVGTTSSKTLDIHNDGNSTLTVSSITYPAGFSGGWSGGQIPAGAAQGVTVTFAPTAVQSYGGTITVNSDATSGTNTIAASGQGIQISDRIIRLGVGGGGDLSFGQVRVGTTASKTLNIHNDGNSTLTVSSISYPAGFSGGWSGGQIPAGSAQGVTVTFAPTAVQSYGGTITVNSDATSGANTIAASGQGTQASTRVIRLGVGGGGDLSFGQVQVGTTANKTLNIHNDGNSTLTVSSISYPVGFSGGWSGGQIPAGSAQGVTVTFAPTAAQSYGGTITVNCDATSGTNTIAASGQGEGDANGLVEYNFDEGDGTAALDSSGHDANGTLVNGVDYSTEAYTGSYCLIFNGIDGRVDVPRGILENKPDRTIQMWVKTIGSGYLFNFNRWGGCCPGEHVYINADGTVGAYHYSAADIVITGTTAVNDGQWHHVVFSLSSAEGVKLYVDGALEASDARPSVPAPASSNNHCTIGCSSSGNGSHYDEFFAGEIDEFRID